MSSGSVPTTHKGNWPDPAQFNEAVQNLATSVSDRELQGGEAEQGPLGLPMPYAGNFADVYKVHCPATGNTWAVKFFKREVRDLRDRYKAISDQLVIAQLPFTVDFRYIEDGVRIGGAWFPLVKMRWIEGQSLNRFVAQSLAQPKLLDQLFDLWVKVANRLRLAGIAHADLQHGNVVLVPHGDQGKLLLKLIDYDGMYVPALGGKQSGELGHANYQHPSREQTRAYNAELDRFSHLAICTALRCLSAGGMPLWERFNNEENLLFTARDFACPGSSKLFRELWTLRNPDARALVGYLALATQRPLEQAPLIEELVNDGRVQQLTADQQSEVQRLLFNESTPVAAPVTTVEPAAPARDSGNIVLQPWVPPAAIPVAGPSVATAAVARPTEVVEAELVQPFSLASALLLPFLLFDRMLGWIAGPEHLLLHNFMRVVSVGVAVSAGPAAYYAATTRSKPQPIVQVETLRQSPTEAPQPEPEPIVESDPDAGPQTTPGEMPPDSSNDPPMLPESPTVGEPGPPSLFPPEETPSALPAVAGRPFERLTVLENGLHSLVLPPLKNGDNTAKTLGRLQLATPDDLQITLLGAGVVFPTTHFVEVQKSITNLGTGEVRHWNVVCRKANVGGGGFGAGGFGGGGFGGAGAAAKEEQLGQFALKADSTLTFRWTAPSKSGVPPAALKYCLLQMLAAGEMAVCTLGVPTEAPSPKVAFSDNGSLTTLAISELDASVLPPVNQLVASFSVAGRSFQPGSFLIEQRREGGAAASELLKSGAAGLSLANGIDGLGPLVELKGALWIDPQKASGARIVLAPFYHRRINKNDFPFVESQTTSLSRIAKLAEDGDGTIKRQNPKREKKTNVQQIEKWNQELGELQEKYNIQSDLLATETSARSIRIIEGRMKSLGEKMNRLESLLGRVATEDAMSLDQQSTAETLRTEYQLAYDELNALQAGPLDLRVYYELDTPLGRMPLDVLRVGSPSPVISDAAAPAGPFSRFGSP